MAGHTLRIAISMSPGARVGRGNGENLSLHTKFPVIKRVDEAWEKRTGHFLGDQSWDYTSRAMS